MILTANTHTHTHTHTRTHTHTPNPEQCARRCELLLSTQILEHLGELNVAPEELEKRGLLRFLFLSLSSFFSFSLSLVPSL